MDKLTVTLMPFPHVYEGQRRDGLTHEWPDRCRRCRDRQCEASTAHGVQACSYGYNFQRIDNSLLIAGFVLRESSQDTKARRKAIRQVGPRVVSIGDLQAVVAAAERATNEVEDSIASLKLQIMDDYRRSEQYKSDLADLLKPSIEQAFAQVHDYRQLISQIVQHVNVFLETRFPGLTLDEQLEQAEANIRSIYWAARLMEYKLLSALFLAYPERINDPRHKRRFRLHGAIHKYLQIYRPLIDARHLKLRVVGESHGTLMENPDAVGVIPQAFLDNAIKYAPAGSEVYVTFTEDDESISIEVQSEGPHIASHERAQIFELFFRGEAARRSGEEGTGFGLGLAELVADRIGAKLAVNQSSARLASGAFQTTFSATFPKLISGEGPPRIVNARARRRGGPSGA